MKKKLFLFAVVCTFMIAGCNNNANEDQSDEINGILDEEEIESDKNSNTVVSSSSGKDEIADILEELDDSIKVLEGSIEVFDINGDEINL